MSVPICKDCEHYIPPNIYGTLRMINMAPKCMEKALGGDPLRVLMSKEAHSCKGCKYKDEMWGKEFCNHPQRTSV